MEKFSLLEVVEQAVQTERVGYRFYTETAEQFRKNPKLRELFTTLAANEKIHEENFTKLKSVVESEGEVDWEDVSQYLRAIVESEFFLGRDKSLAELSKVKTAQDAVRTAIGFEKETLLYFYALRDLVNKKELVDRIIAEEKSHILSLSNLARTL